MAAALFFKKKRLLLSLPRQYGGKTELGVRLLEDITARPFTSSSLFLAKDKKSGKKATREKFMRLFDAKTFDVNTEQVTLKACPSSVIFMDSVDKDPARMRGGTYSAIHWSEVAFSKIELGETIISVFDKIIQPTLRMKGGYVLLESTNNGKNGWWDLWHDYKTYGFERLRVSFSQMLELGLVSLEEFEEVRRTTHPDVFRQEYECEWVTFQGKAYNEFDENTHVSVDVAPPEPWQRVISAIDWGYDPSATAILFGYVRDGTIFIFDEIYEKRQLIEQTAADIELHLKHWGIEHHAAVADHEEDRNDELTRRNIAVTKADKVNVQGARLQIKEKLWNNAIRIHPRCEFLIKDLQSAVWHPKKEGELDYSQCTYGHFDCEAALRYLVRELSGSEVDEPIVNPHRATDDASSRAWLMNREMGE